VYDAKGKFYVVDPANVRFHTAPVRG
jgi:hypothetical protein